MSRCWLLVACLALCLAESGLAASFAEEDPVSPTLVPYADSIAASLVKVAPPQRLARWTSTRETRQVREQGRLFEEVADTLGDELLFAVHQFGSQGIEPSGTTPAAFRSFMADESAKWGKLIRETGIKAQ